MTFVKIIGSESYYDPCWGRGDVRTNKRIEMIIIKQDTDVQYIPLNKVYHSSYNEKNPKLVNGNFTLRGYNVWVDEICECTQEEKDFLIQEMNKRNMYWGEISFQRYNPIYRTPHENRTKYETLLWKDKDLFPIVLNGVRMTYKQLKETKHDDFVTLSGDNGYSHCWAESSEFDKVFSLIEKMFRQEEDFTFEEKVKGNFTFAFNRVHFGSIYGYTFDEYGALVLRTTTSPIKPTHIVSNT